MKYLSPLISDGRNKLGGTVWSRNRSGLYQRAYVTPRNPQTTAQQAHRAQYKTCSDAWHTLTRDQVVAWNAAALGVTLTDSLGQKSHPTGYQLFMRCNLNFQSGGYGPILDVQARASQQIIGGPPSMTATASGGALTDLELLGGLFELNGNAYATLQMTPPLSPGVSFVAPHLYRNILTESLNGFTPSPSQWSAVFPGATPVTGQQLGWRLRLWDEFCGYQICDYSGTLVIG